MINDQDGNGPLIDREFFQSLAEVRSAGLLDFRSLELPNWCAGCGYYGLLHAFTRALADLRLDPDHLVVVSDYGCSGWLPFFMNCYGFQTAHGRAVPVAGGVKMTRPDLTVVAVSGDGGALGAGLGHLAHAIRRNVAMCCLLLDNGRRGLMRGQASPATPTGEMTPMHPYGQSELPLNPLVLALDSGASFVARGYAGDPDGLARVIREALGFRGFSLVVAVCPCVTFDHGRLTYEALRGKWAEIDAGHDPCNLQAALALARSETWSRGIFYRQARPTWEDAQREIMAKALSVTGPA